MIRTLGALIVVLALAIPVRSQSPYSFFEIDPKCTGNIVCVDVPVRDAPDKSGIVRMPLCPPDHVRSSDDLDGCYFEFFIKGDDDKQLRCAGWDSDWSCYEK